MFWGKTNETNKQNKTNSITNIWAEIYEYMKHIHINIWDIINIRNKYMSIFSPMQWFLYQFQKLFKSAKFCNSHQI